MCLAKVEVKQLLLLPCSGMNSHRDTQQALTCSSVFEQQCKSVTVWQDTSKS